MTTMTSLLSPAYQAFLNEAPKHAGAWMQAVHGLGGASALDKKTEALAYLAVLAAPAALHTFDESDGPTAR